MFKTFAPLMLMATLAVMAEGVNLDKYINPSHRKQCLEENKVTKEELHAFQSGKSKLEDIKGDFKCYSYCILNLSKVLDDDNKLKVNESLAQAAGISTQKVEDCKAETDLIDDKCDYAYRILECLIKP